MKYIECEDKQCLYYIEGIQGNGYCLLENEECQNQNEKIVEVKKDDTH